MVTLQVRRQKRLSAFCWQFRNRYSSTEMQTVLSTTRVPIRSNAYKFRRGPNPRIGVQSVNGWIKGRLKLPRFANVKPTRATITLKQVGRITTNFVSSLTINTSWQAKVAVSEVCCAFFVLLGSPADSRITLPRAEGAFSWNAVSFTCLPLFLTISNCLILI
jgi:hypothetical protein